MDKTVSGPGGKPIQDQKFNMEDFLKITDRTPKIVEYDRKRGIVFMLNKEKPSTQSMRLYCIKLRNVENNGSDSDDDNIKKRALSFGGDP